jgi:Cu(I)/Ag(I) efflux system membrane protein CusA/SilA
MLVYLNQAYQEMDKKHQLEGVVITKHAVFNAVQEGAGKRVRPVMMTAAAIIIGLLPILYGTGTGSEIMSRIVAPMVGGMVSAVILTLLVLPALFYLWRVNALKGDS